MAININERRIKTMKEIIEQYVDHLNLRNASPHTIRTIWPTSSSLRV